MQSTHSTINPGVRSIKRPLLPEIVLTKLFSSSGICFLTLIMAVFISAFAIIYVKDLNRHLFSELQAMQMVSQQIDVEWGQLRLEQSAWSTQARVQQIAQDHLGMESSALRTIRVVKDSDIRR